MPDVKKRGLTAEDARKVRQAGHDDAKAFAKLLGMPDDYQNDRQAKKDVIDPSGDAHSVKSGKKKWQLFLYSANRFLNDPGFSVMNGMGDLLVSCIHAFPASYFDYLKNKVVYKQNLQKPMQDLCEKLQDRKRLKAFFAKSMFNGAEVNYLTVKEESFYHIFAREDVLNVFSEQLQVENSKARNSTQMNNQKVIFKYKGINLAELEMRNDSEVHYREIRFNMIRPRAMEVLFAHINEKKEHTPLVLKYGKAIKSFGRWLNIKT